MRKHLITEDDLKGEMRKIAGVKYLNEIDEAYFENSGEISIIMPDKKIVRPKEIED